ncbi:MAG: MATE family efflux transporter [Candidatus Obscuribacterales bacterium]|nr:MATE family efflux transporter [Candidatus Obscuribacterales bacterium]
MDTANLESDKLLDSELSEFSKEELDLLLEGPIWKAIASMSVPMILNALAISAATFADAYVAGRLGSDDLAAVGIGGQVWFGMIIMAIAIATGANALVSRFWGAKDYDAAMEAARQSIFSAVVFGFVSSLVGVFCTDIFLQLLGASPKVAALGSSYLKIQFLAQLPLTMLWVCHSIFRAKGDANLPTLIMAMVTVGVVILDFLLCLWPLNMGISGIGVAWLLSSSLGCLLMFIALKKSELSHCVDISESRPFNFSIKWMKRIMAIGLPACLQDLAWVTSNFGLFLIFSQTAKPTDYQAAWAVGLRVEDVLAGLPIFAMSMGVATVIGQNIGAKKLERAVKVGWQAAAIGCALMAVVGAIMFFAAEQIAKMMTADPAVAQYSKEYLQILGISEPITVIWLVLFGAMEGAGYTKIPMFFAFFCLLLVRVPLAYLFTLSMNMGAFGAWLAIALTSVVGALIAVFWFQKGSWKHHEI